MTYIIIAVIGLIVAFWGFRLRQKTKFVGFSTIVFKASTSNCVGFDVQIQNLTTENHDNELSRLILHCISRFAYIRIEENIREVQQLLNLLQFSKKVTTIEELLRMIAYPIKLTDQFLTAPVITISGALHTVKPAPDQRILQAKVPLKHHPNQFYTTVVALLTRAVEERLITGSAEKMMIEAMRTMADTYNSIPKNDMATQQTLPNDAFLAASLKTAMESVQWPK